MNKPIFSAAVLCLCTGCAISHGPSNETSFNSSSSLKQLEGCYENKGDGGQDNGARYLSSLVFPKSKIPGQKISHIHVAFVTEKSLQVSAESGGDVIQEAIFTEGKDFYFDSGRIKISSEGGGIAPTEPGSVFLGVAHASKYLGIDKNGDGKLEESGTVLGTVFLIFPVAASINESFSFRKTPGQCQGQASLKDRPIGNATY